MNKALLNKEIQDFIRKHYKEDISKIVLSGSPFAEINVQELATQLFGRKKAEKKLPTWFNTDKIIYPSALNLEQTSSEKTAAYKASLTSGNTLIDLTGGFGIDAYFFSENFSRVIHCEQNEELSKLVRHNNEVLNRKNVDTYTGDSINFLQQTKISFDWIYIDPSRRDDAGGRVFLLHDCLPNVPDHLELLFGKAPNILVKTSPLLDIHAGLTELRNVRQIHVVAVDNDVKELLWILEKEFSGEPKIVTANLRNNGEDQYFTAPFSQDTEVSFHSPLTYLYEPNAAIMKSGQINALGEDDDLYKLHPNSQLFTSEKLKSFPGRRFEIQQALSYHKKKLRKELDLKQANITTRNFPLTVENLRKQLKISDGGDYYLFFTTLEGEEKVCLVCKKV